MRPWTRPCPQQGLSCPTTPSFCKKLSASLLHLIFFSEPFSFAEDKDMFYYQLSEYYEENRDDSDEFYFFPEVIKLF